MLTVRFTRKRPWLDRDAGVYRRRGEQADVSAKRAKVIVASGAGEILGPARGDKPKVRALIRADELTGEQIITMPREQIIKVLVEAVSAMTVRDVLELERRAENPRKTVIEAAEKRLRDLQGE